MSQPFFSIITPSVMRPSLLDTCKSIEDQSFVSWQHVIAVDSPNLDPELIGKINHPQRIIMKCDKPHRNSGNTCRHNAWKLATGTYAIHLDDDNVLSSLPILQKIYDALESKNFPEWGLFPILRHGNKFFYDPPQPCFFDTANAVVKREIAQWPDIPDYASDAVWLENSLKKYPYEAFPNIRPIVIMPETSFGAGGGINGQ
jgi:hypothetical protein